MTLDSKVDSIIHPTRSGGRRRGAVRSRWFPFIANSVLLVSALVLLFTVQPDSSEMRTGAVTGSTVTAQHSVTYLDRAATQARKTRAMSQVPEQYKIDLRPATQLEQQAAIFLDRASHVVDSALSPQEKQDAMRRMLPPDASSTGIQELAGLSPADFKVVQTRSISLLKQAIGWRFGSSQLTATAIALLSTVASQVTTSQRTAISTILTMFLHPTSVPDSVRTLTLQRAAAATVAPVYNTIPSGEVIVRRGDLITPEVMQKLTALGLQRTRTGLRDFAGSVLFTLVILSMLFWYLYAFHGDIITNGRLLLLVDASILVTVAAARFLTPGHMLLPYFMPVASISTFAAVLIAPEAAVAIAFAMAVLAGWIVANSFELTVYYFLSSAAGVLSIRNVRHLKQFMIAGVNITIFALATALAFAFVDRSYDLSAVRDFMVAAVTNGFLSSTLALGGFVLLSDLFGVTTMLRLFELGQPNQPALRRLMVRAPGTYNHSLIVASMAERAADEIGANSLVAKAGALYHDVGKTANPHCFVENQLGIGNIHDELSAEDSARIILGHVTQGLRLARQYKLPRSIQDAIAQHHGTMSINYFLHKAQQEMKGGYVDISQFSYPGPRPQTKETALIMLADGCESAVRAATDHSQERIRELVHRIVRERIDQGQLNECPLTLHDLEHIETVFRSVLNGLYHPRIDYPERIDLQLGSRIALTTGPGQEVVERS